MRDVIVSFVVLCLSMPVYSFSVFSSSSFYLLWKIEESLEVLQAQLHPHFLVNFHSGCSAYAYKDRLRQSLAVRIALYCLLKKLNLPILTLSKDARGRPILGNYALHLSFTHTRYWAAVALSTAWPIGIDIEMVQPRLHRIQGKFLTEKESKHANNCLDVLAIYWCAKEALYKRLDQQPTCTFKHIFIEPFQLQAKGEIMACLHQKKYIMGYKQIMHATVSPHVLVYCKN